MLELMSGVLGAPSERIWPGMRALPHADKYRLPPQPFNYLRKVGWGGVGGWGGKRGARQGGARWLLLGLAVAARTARAGYGCTPTPMPCQWPSCPHRALPWLCRSSHG